MSLIEKEIPDEEYREYDFPGRPQPYRINNPKFLVYREGGTTHRIVDSTGIVHCVPGPGILGCVLRWKNRNPNKPVNF
jgi:hypothetical protein